jgi:hypothetical protein
VNVIFLSATFGVPSQTGTPTLIVRQKIWEMQTNSCLKSNVCRLHEGSMRTSRTRFHDGGRGKGD